MEFVCLKVAKIVVIFVAIFAVCWLPRHAYLLHWHFSRPSFNVYLHAFKAVAFCLMFIYSAINPFALYVINEQFRRYFDHYLCGRCDSYCFAGKLSLPVCLSKSFIKTLLWAYSS